LSASKEHSADESSVFGPVPPRDGREWDCQCARCGSSCTFIDCWDCNGIAYEEWAEQCRTCDGRGGYEVCISGDEWCEVNPIKGRERVARGDIEWFVVASDEEVAAADERAVLIQLGVADEEDANVERE
jgi:hypothetical protein